MRGVIEELVHELPLPQRLALSYAPAASRSLFLAVMALDARLAMIVRKRHEVVLAQIRIAWWRDTLRRPVSEWPRGDAVLGMLRTWQGPETLAALADGWEVLLDETLGPASIDEFGRGREAAFMAVAEELGLPDASGVAPAARCWALADLAANLSAAEEREPVVALGRLGAAPAALPRQMRPLAVLAGLGWAALARGGGPLLDGPTDGLRALRIGLIGR